METAHLFPFQKLDVYVAAKELARRVQVAKIADAELRDQGDQGRQVGVPVPVRRATQRGCRHAAEVLRHGE